MDLINITDHEKELISNELYHEASQTIYSLLLGIRMTLALEMSSALKEYLLELEKNADKSLERIRELAFTIHPLMINDLGFLPTLRTYIAKEEEQYRCKIKLLTNGQMKNPNLEKELMLYRICHESLLYLREKGSKEMILTIDFDSDTEIKASIESSLCNWHEEKVDVDTIIDQLFFTKKRVESYRGTFQIELLSYCKILIQFTLPNDSEISPQAHK